MAPRSNPGTLGAALVDAAQRRGDAIFLVEGDHSHSFNDLLADSRRLSAALIASGIGSGDRVGLLSVNQVEWIQLFFAVTQIGAVVVGMSPRYRDSELEYMVNDSKVKAVFTLAKHDGHDFVRMFERLAPRLPTLGLVVPIGSDSWHSFIDQPAGKASLEERVASVRSGDLAMVIYTSGTTGRPKGAGLTHASMLAAARAQTEHMRLHEHDLFQLSLPLNHVGGITCGMLAMLVAGGTTDLVAEFKAEAVLNRIRRHRSTWLTGVPTMMTLLLMKSRELDVNLDSVRVVTVGGSNVDEALWSQLKDRFPKAMLMNLYGLSEASGAIVMTPQGCSLEDVVSTIGRPIGDAEVKVVGTDGQSLPSGEVGELCFRRAGVIPGYVGAGAASDAVAADGWLRTGDLGQVDARGLITLKGRAKDMYIQGGFNVYPAEIEGFIARHPDVLMVAGVGVPDPVMGEVGRYFIVTRPGSRLASDDLRAWCAAGLADYKVPRQFVFRDVLPLTPAGKIHKAALRAEASQ